MKLLTVSVTQLIGKDVAGITAQVRGPAYIRKDDPTRQPVWRELTHVKTFTERGKKWVELYWKRGLNDSCNFSGCTLDASSPYQLQLKEQDFHQLGLTL